MNTKELYFRAIASFIEMNPHQGYESVNHFIRDNLTNGEYKKLCELGEFENLSD